MTFSKTSTRGSQNTFRYTNDELSEITSEIISIFNKILNSCNNLDVLKFILDTVGSIRYGEPNEKSQPPTITKFQDSVDYYNAKLFEQAR